ncbi:MAG: aminoacetone oxidase family FAD-binding enzyme [Proteobacteria bacterium]|nr:MAG: aminoacetone oxidase family FAD-binding enzyme [Pseudomonadota bacterium]
MHYRSVILGAGAAGLMCAAHAGGDCLIVDHAKAPGEKIRISGGGRCNFTNLDARPEAYLSSNPHFCKSALSRFTQWDFIAQVDAAGIAWHEKTLGQLFCDGSAKQIVEMLVSAAKAAGADLWLRTTIVSVGRAGSGFAVELEREGHRVALTCDHLVLATGGKSIPKMGATGLAYRLAEQFGLKVTETRAGLVPLTFPKERFEGLAGVSLPAAVQAGGARFAEALLFTHRGLSGPSVLQASSYWREGEEVSVDLLPGRDMAQELAGQRQVRGRGSLRAALRGALPTRLADHLATEWALTGNLADQSDAALRDLDTQLHDWRLRPAGSEGYRTAEVTLGGIDTDGLSSKTMEARGCPGLFAIGEAVDVTGWLGGYNFQWAWSSGWAAGTAIATN